ncbi:3'-5' exonuclease [Entophlyctis luteolus]|nr:3'-5' exonuclease [Entophlyctis luteolus]
MAATTTTTPPAASTSTHKSPHSRLPLSRLPNPPHMSVSSLSQSLSQSLSHSPRCSDPSLEDSLAARFADLRQGERALEDALRVALLLAPATAALNSHPPPPPPPPSLLLALDCEMVLVSTSAVDSSHAAANATNSIAGNNHPSTAPALARISICDFWGSVLLDTFVVPELPIVDYKTQFSGVTPELLAAAPSHASVVAKVREICSDAHYLVGQSIDNDLAVLGMIDWPIERVRDTALFFRRFHPLGKTPGLKDLARWCLDLQIQTGEHDSTVDARAAMLLYRQQRFLWETTCPVHPPFHQQPNHNSHRHSSHLQQPLPPPIPCHPSLPSGFKEAMQNFELQRVSISGSTFAPQIPQFTPFVQYQQIQQQHMYPQAATIFPIAMQSPMNLHYQANTRMFGNSVFTIPHGSVFSPAPLTVALSNSKVQDQSPQIVPAIKEAVPTTATSTDAASGQVIPMVRETAPSAPNTNRPGLTELDIITAFYPSVLYKPLSAMARRKLLRLAGPPSWLVPPESAAATSAAGTASSSASPPPWQVDEVDVLEGLKRYRREKLQKALDAAAAADDDDVDEDGNTANTNSKTSGNDSPAPRVKHDTSLPGKRKLAKRKREEERAAAAAAAAGTGTATGASDPAESGADLAPRESMTQPRIKRIKVDARGLLAATKEFLAVASSSSSSSSSSAAAAATVPELEASAADPDEQPAAGDRKKVGPPKKDKKKKRHSQDDQQPRADTDEHDESAAGETAHAAAIAADAVPSGVPDKTKSRKSKSNAKSDERASRPEPLPDTLPDAAAARNKNRSSRDKANRHPRALPAAAAAAAGHDLGLEDDGGAEKATHGRSADPAKKPEKQKKKKTKDRDASPPAAETAGVPADAPSKKTRAQHPADPVAAAEAAPPSKKDKKKKTKHTREHDADVAVAAQALAEVSDTEDSGMPKDTLKKKEKKEKKGKEKKHRKAVASSSSSTAGSDRQLQEAADDAPKKRKKKDPSATAAGDRPEPQLPASRDGDGKERKSKRSRTDDGAKDRSAKKRKS